MIAINEGHHEKLPYLSNFLFRDFLQRFAVDHAYPDNLKEVRFRSTQCR